MHYGVITLIPIILLFVLIFKTKRMILSLTAASITGAVILGGWNFADVWITKVQEAFKGGTIGYLFLLLALFGIFVRLLDKSQAVMNFANWLSKFANTRKKALLLTYLLGWIICIDDYLNNIAVSTAMKKVCDKHRIPRTLFGYVVNCTAAPVCILVPVSTWAVFYSGLFKEYKVTVNGSGLAAYISSVPYMFYGWISLAICLLVILGVIPLLGVTKRDNKQAMETGIVCSAEENADGVEIRTDESDEDKKKGNNPFAFLIPLAVIIVITIVTSNCMIGCMAAIAVSAIISIISKKMTLIEIFDASWEGVTSMVSVCGVITVAMTLVEINKATGMPNFIVGLLTPLLKGALFPAIVFAFCSVYSYFGGGFWDMSMIFMPIVVPIANALGLNPLLPCVALVCASAAGSTTYVAGDAIMISSRVVDIKPYYQMIGTLPYALISYGLSIVGFVIAGFAMN